MGKLYITRHGETEWNVAARMQGWLDSPLTEQGRYDAMRLGQRLAADGIEVAYTSPLGRAMETTELILGGLEGPQRRIVPTDSLKEIGLGDWEGRLRHDIEQEEPFAYHAFWNAPHEYRPKSGETFESLFERVKVLHQELLQVAEDKDVLVVSHAVTIKALTAIVKRIPLEHTWDQPFIRGASLTLVEVENGAPRVLCEGDIAHLDDGMQ